MFEMLESRICLSAAPIFPVDRLPWNIQKIADGSRAAWSPNGMKIAFVDKQFGNAFEYNLKTRTTRALTDLIKDPHILRVQYLPNGDYLLTAPAQFKDDNVSRWNDGELWVMRQKHRSTMYRLGQKVYEGTAISRSKNLIAFSTDQRQYPGTNPTLHTGEITYSPRGIPYLVNERVLFSQSSALEAQDFRNHDHEVVYADYSGVQASVRGYNFSTHKLTTYRTSDAEYNEPEGIFPDGNFELIESSRDKGDIEHLSQNIDVWKLQLKPRSRNFARLTRFGDLGPFKASNGVVRPDGTMIAFQQSVTGATPGTGAGVYLMNLFPTASQTIASDTFNSSHSAWTTSGGRVANDGHGRLALGGGSKGEATTTSVERSFNTKGFSNIVIRLDASQSSGAYSTSDSLKIEVDSGHGFERLLTDAEQFNGVDNASADKLTGNDANITGASTGYLALPVSASNNSIRVRISATTTESNQAYLLGSFAVQGTPV